MVKFTELLHALYTAHDNDDTQKLIAADALDDAAGGNEGDSRFPARFLKFRAEWIRACTGSGRRNHYGLSHPERKFLDDREGEFRPALEAAISRAGKWSGERCAIEYRGRFAVARVRVAHPVKPKATLGATIKFEFRRGFVYRLHVHELAFRELAPVALVAFPEATVRYLPGDTLTSMYYPGLPLGTLPPGSHPYHSYGCYLTCDHVPHLFADFETIVRGYGWACPTLKNMEGVVGIKPGTRYPNRPDEVYHTFPPRNAALVALDAAATLVARRAAGIDHHFAAWWDHVKHPAKLDGINDDVVACRQAERKENWK